MFQRRTTISSDFIMAVYLEGKYQKALEVLGLEDTKSHRLLFLTGMVRGWLENPTLKKELLKILPPGYQSLVDVLIQTPVALPLFLIQIFGSAGMFDLPSTQMILNNPFKKITILTGFLLGDLPKLEDADAGEVLFDKVPEGLPSFVPTKKVQDS